MWFLQIAQLSTTMSVQRRVDQPHRRENPVQRDEKRARARPTPRPQSYRVPLREYPPGQSARDVEDGGRRNTFFTSNRFCDFS